MSKIGIKQWLESNGHKQLTPPPKKQIKIYEYEGFVLESWTDLDVPPINKWDAYNHKRFIFASKEESQTPLFREYKAKVISMLPVISQDEQSYLHNNNFLLEICFVLKTKTYAKTMNYLEPFLKIFGQKYGIEQTDTIYNINIIKKVAAENQQESIRFKLTRLTPQVSDNDN